MEIAFLTPLPEPDGGGSAFNAGLVPALRAQGHQVTVTDRLAEAPHGVPIVDGMLLPRLENEIEALLARDAVAVVHHVSAAAGRDMTARNAVGECERRMLPRLRRVVTTSRPVAERLAAQFGVAAPLLLQPGLPDLPRSTGSAAGCAILCVGVLTPRKGHDRLLTALARLTDLDWSLTVAGDAGRDPVHADTLAAQVEALGLQNRVTLLRNPAQEELQPLWAGADLFATATGWEGYPAALAEAMRRGIPIVAPDLPGIEALVPPGAGVLHKPDDLATFGKCLRRVIFDHALRTELADGAWQAGAVLPGWDEQARTFVSILKG